MVKRVHRNSHPPGSSFKFFVKFATYSEGMLYTWCGGPRENAIDKTRLRIDLQRPQGLEPKATEVRVNGRSTNGKPPAFPGGATPAPSKTRRSTNCVTLGMLGRSRMG